MSLYQLECNTIVWFSANVRDEIWKQIENHAVNMNIVHVVIIHSVGLVYVIYTSLIK